MTLVEIIEQLESCNYECEAGTLSNNAAFVELKKMASNRYRFASDDDGHRYVIPDGKREEFDAWLEHEQKLWKPGLSDEEFERVKAEYEGEDFNGYRIGGAPSLISFVDPKSD